jgi:hypothetical protein
VRNALGEIATRYLSAPAPAIFLEKFGLRWMDEMNSTSIRSIDTKEEKDMMVLLALLTRANKEPKHSISCHLV